MNNRNKVIITYGLWIIDIITVVLSFGLATFIRFFSNNDIRDTNIYFMVCILMILSATVYTFVVPWHNDTMKRRPISELWKIIKMNIFMIVVTQTLMFFLKWSDIVSRWVMVYFVALDVVLAFLFHMLFKQVMKKYYNSDLVKVKVLVITEKALKDEVEERLKARLDMSYQMLETVLLEEMPEDFKEKAMQMAVDEVFIYAADADKNIVFDILKFFDDMGVVCNYCVEIPGLDSNRSHADSFADYTVLNYSHFHASYKRLLLKRVFDIFGALIGCIITIVFLPFVALAIKINSKGPVFFKQVRIGRNGRRFKIWKFRSMYIDAEERKKELESQNQVEGLMFKMDNDPRITKVGKFLRKTSIDELPQFFNILKGDMSLIGTRPPTVDEFEKYNQYYRRRLSMTPGLTGLWQVSGRSDIENFDEVVKLDLQYIDNWSLGLDLKILLKTIKVVFMGKGSK